MFIFIMFVLPIFGLLLFLSEKVPKRPLAFSLLFYGLAVVFFWLCFAYSWTNSFWEKLVPLAILSLVVSTIILIFMMGVSVMRIFRKEDKRPPSAQE